MDKHLKYDKLKKIKKTLNIVFLFLLSILIFFRWTGLIDETIFSWKRPEISLLKNNPFEQKNDQLWVNVTFNKNHAHVKEAQIWIDDDDSNAKNLKNGTQTYIFKNLNNGIHKVNYKYKWSLFGEKSGDFNVEMDEVSKIFFNPFTDLKRYEDKITIKTKVVGNFLDFDGDGKNSAGIYYVNTELINHWGITRFNIKEKIIKKILNKEFSIKDWIKILNEIFIKQIDLNSGDVEINDITEIKVKNDPNDTVIEKLSDHKGKNYGLFPFGFSIYQKRIYVSFAPFFNAYVWGIPLIKKINSHVEEKGTIVVDQIDIDKNNFDSKGKNYLQIEVLNNIEGNDNWQTVSTKIIEYNEFKRKKIKFDGIMTNEDLFPIDSDLTKPLTYKIKVQLKYGYNDDELPDKDIPGPKNSNILVSQVFSLSSSWKSSDEEIIFNQPYYQSIYNEDHDFEKIKINWESSEWINLPEKNSKVSAYWKVVNKNDNTLIKDYTLIDEINKIDFKNLSNGKTNDTIFTKDDFIDIKENKIIISLHLYVPTFNWWGDKNGEDEIIFLLNDVVIE